MPIEGLTEEQRTALAERVLLVLAELWCDQFGIEAEIRIVHKDDTTKD